MAEKRKFLDVWIVESNTVYREVPITVVMDWTQQGRLLEDDKLRTSGTEKWQRLGDIRALAAFLPKSEPMRAEDQAEALEPVEVDFTWKRPSGDEDDDPDMIPLIDISLVLLIFFMMTAAVSSGYFSPIKTPGAKHQLAQITKDMLWVGVDTKGKEGKTENGADGKPATFYSLGIENTVLEPPTPNVNDVLGKLDGFIAEKTLAGEIRLRIRANENLPIETVSKTTLELQGLEQKLNRQRDKASRLSFVISGEVSEPKGK